jgi:hypothetical protein
MLYVWKIPTIFFWYRPIHDLSRCSSFAIHIALKHNRRYTFTEEIGQDELLEIVESQDDGFVFDNYEFSADFLNDYSVNQVNAAKRIELWTLRKIDIEGANWLWFISLDKDIV